MASHNHQQAVVTDQAASLALAHVVFDEWTFAHGCIDAAPYDVAKRRVVGTAIQESILLDRDIMIGQCAVNCRGAELDASTELGMSVELRDPCGHYIKELVDKAESG